MKKKVTIVVVIVLVIVLIAACVMWRIGGVETESALGDHQKYVYAYVSSIEGNEVTYREVHESVAKAAEERAKNRPQQAEARKGGSVQRFACARASRTAERFPQRSRETRAQPHASKSP